MINRIAMKILYTPKKILFLVLFVVGLPVAVVSQTVIFSDDFETDKGWTLTGEFERGTPNGNAGESPDHGNDNPVGAYEGSFAIGTDLDGAYPNDLGDR